LKTCLNQAVDARKCSWSYGKWGNIALGHLTDLSTRLENTNIGATLRPETAGLAGDITYFMLISCAHCHSIAEMIQSSVNAKTVAAMTAIQLSTEDRSRHVLCVTETYYCQSLYAATKEH